MLVAASTTWTLTSSFFRAVKVTAKVKVVFLLYKFFLFKSYTIHNISINMSQEAQLIN